MRLIRKCPRVVRGKDPTQRLVQDPSYIVCKGYNHTSLRKVLRIQNTLSVINKKHLGPTSRIKRIHTRIPISRLTLVMTKTYPRKTKQRIMILKMRIRRMEAFLWPCMWTDWRSLAYLICCWTRPGTRICMDPVSQGLMRTLSPRDFRILMVKKSCRKALECFNPSRKF